MTFKYKFAIILDNIEKLTPRPELLAKHSDAVAEVAKQRAGRFLDKQPGEIASKVINLFIQQEVELALERYGKMRLRGHANDDCSEKPGLTMYLTPLGRERAVRMCWEEGSPIADTQIKEVTTDLIALRLPRGVYGMGMGGAQFYQKVNADWEQSNRADNPFALDYNDVVRVEGDADELWQNADYHWDGTPRTA